MTLANKYSEASIKSTWALIQFLIYWNWALIYVCWEEEKIPIQDNLSETASFYFHNAYFFMIWYCSWGQTSEIKQRSHVGTLGHSENWVLLPKNGK